MKKMKQMLSWLIIFAMVFSLVPVSPVQAEGEEGGTEYSVWLTPFIEAKNGCLGGYSADDFSLSVPEGQEGVSAGENEGEYKVKDSFTFHITVPEGYGTDYMEVLNNGEVLENISFESQGGNVYAVTIPVMDDMNLSVRDASYSCVRLDYVTSNFYCYLMDGENEQPTMYVRQDGSCTFYIRQKNAEIGNIDDLEITANGETISTDSLVKDNDIWSYTIADVTQNQDIKIYEKGGAITLTVDGLPESGYEVLDAEGVKCEITGGQACFSTEKYGTVTFQVQGDTDALDYGLFLNEAELPATKKGENTYSYTVSDISWPTTVSFKKKYKVTSNISVIPCTQDGSPLEGYEESGVEAFYACSMHSIYFRLADTDGRYAISLNGGEGSVWQEETGVYCFSMSEQDSELTAVRQYGVSIGSNGNCNVAIPDADYVFDEDKYYVNGQVEFTVTVSAGYNAENMQVTLIGQDGTPIEIQSVGEPSVNEDGETVYAFTSGAVTQDAVLNVAGIYSNEPYDIYVEYDADDFKDIEVRVVDEEGNVIPEESEFDADYTHRGLYEGKTYRLILSSETADLSEIKAYADGENLVFSRDEDGSYVADITSKSYIQLVMGDKHRVEYVCSDDLGEGELQEYGSGDNIGGFYNAGDLKFFIAARDGYTAEHAVVEKIIDSKGSEVSFTKQENVEVDDYGTRGAVYTVNVTDDITIYYKGLEKSKCDLYMPVPSATDGYTIDNVSVSYDWGDSFEAISGKQDDKKTYTKYSDLFYGTLVQFDITVPKDSKVPLVQEKVSDASLDDTVMTMNAHSVETNEDGSKTQHYRLWITRTVEILVTVNTKEIEVVTKNGIGCVEYDEEAARWNIYDSADENTRKLTAYIVDLPKVVDKADTDRKYDFYLDFVCLDEETGDYHQLYRLKKNSGAAVFKAYDVNDQVSSSLCKDEDAVDSGDYTLPAGYYKLEVDTSCIVTQRKYISLSSVREDMAIAPANNEGAGYEEEKLEDGQTVYIPDSDIFYFTVTAEEQEAFEDMCIDWSYTDHDAEYTESNGGLTRTYKLQNIESDADIRVAYQSNLEIRNGKNVSLSTNAFWNMEGDQGTTEAGRIVTNLPSNTPFELDLCVKEGYDPDSVTVKHEHSGIVDTYSVYGGHAYHGLDRWCDVILYPGDNVFYATEPKKTVYKMDIPQSVAYTIELVNGSKETVEYGGSFSFRIKEKPGYDLSGIIVTADGQKLTKDKNGVYTISNIKKDYDIGVAGYKTGSFVVTFRDYNGSELGKPQTVAFGKSANAPAAPKRKGYLFAGWDRSFANVKQNLVVTATYQPIRVTKITVRGDITKLAAGKTVLLKADVAPKDALNTGVTWSTSNKKYATVDAKGKVKALKAGAGKTVTITATAKDGSGKKAAYKIKIYKNAVKKIKLSAKRKTVKPGKKVKIKAKVSPSKNINKTLKWSSSNVKYATVNSKGVVTAKKAGKGKTVTITAKATDGSNKKATIKIKIKKK